MANVEQFDRTLALTRVCDVFRKKGFNGTSMQDLVDATGLNRSSIYNSFGSKLALYFDALNHYKSINNMFSSEVCNGSMNGLDKIKRIFKYYLEAIIEDEDGSGCMIMNCKNEMASTNKEIVKWLENNANQIVESLAAFVKEGQEQGVINKKQSARNYALYLSSSMEGLRTTGILNKNRGELEIIVKTILLTIT